MPIIRQIIRFVNCEKCKKGQAIFVKTYKIYLIRHGMTEANDKGLYVGKRDLPLSPSGLTHLLKMRESFDYPSARRFYAAPQLRCRQTLEVLYPGCDVTDAPGLQECDFGEFEGRSSVQLRSDEAFRRWATGESNEIPGGESADAFQYRVMQGFEALVKEILKSGETENVLCLPGGVQMMVLAAYGLPRLQMREWAADSGCGFALRITPELWMREPVAEALCAIPWEKEEQKN